MIQFSGVTKQYSSGRIALRAVSFSIQEQETLFVYGHSGAGKSTLCNLITTQETPSQGHIFANKQNLSLLSKKNLLLYRRSIGVVQQGPTLLSNRTVGENIGLPLELRNATRSRIKQGVSNALASVGLNGKENVYPHRLSLSEQQRVVIARAIVGRPALVVADEPTSAQDQQYTDAVISLLCDLNALKTTVIIATSDSRVVHNRQARFIELKNGSMISSI